jgi:hypothetical protein
MDVESRAQWALESVWNQLESRYQQFSDLRPGIKLQGNAAQAVAQTQLLLRLIKSVESKWNIRSQHSESVGAAKLHPPFLLCVFAPLHDILLRLSLRMSRKDAKKTGWKAESSAHSVRWNRRGIRWNQDCGKLRTYGLESSCKDQYCQQLRGWNSA